MPANRAILLTAPGASAIAVIRIAGHAVEPFLNRHFSRPTSSLRCVHGELRDDDGTVIDDPVIVLHEDGLVADINLHGGAWVVASILELLRQNGFETVESSDRAIDAEWLDSRTMLEREMVAFLSSATTEAGVRMLLAQPAAWERFVASAPSADAIGAVLEDRSLDRLLSPAHIAIVGPPNVGKSTLANQLFAQERSITADLPGTTRDWVGEMANIDRVPVILIDTPGRRNTSDAIESEAIEKSREVVQHASLVLRVTTPETPQYSDSSPSSGTPGQGWGGGPLSNPPPAYRGRESEESSLETSRALAGKIHCSVIDVINKADLLPDFGKASVRRACFTSATTGYGIDSLRKMIRDCLGCGDLHPDRPRCWTVRQKQILRQARDSRPPHDPLSLQKIITG